MEMGVHQGQQGRLHVTVQEERVLATMSIHSSPSVQEEEVALGVWVSGDGGWGVPASLGRDPRAGLSSWAPL